MEIIKLRNIQLQKEILDPDAAFRVGFCEEIQEYVLVVAVFWVATYERYFQISADDYELYLRNAPEFIARHCAELQYVNHPGSLENFLGSAALRDYDCVANLSSLLPYHGNPFNGHVYMYGKLWACIHTDTDVLFVPPACSVMQNNFRRYLMREISATRLISIEVNGEMRPVCYCITKSELSM